jgi:hypothetical protein
LSGIGLHVVDAVRVCEDQVRGFALMKRL